MYDEEQVKEKSGGVKALATFIVDKRNLFFLLYIFAFIFCFFSRNWVQVENDITTYLPESTETRQGLDVMNSNFVTYGSGRIMVSNITYDNACRLKDKIEAVDGVTSVEFENTEEHYHDSSALFNITFDGEEADDISVNAMNEVKELLVPYDSYVSSSVGEDSSAQLASEMLVIVAIAAVVIVVVLTITSHSYAEVPVLILTFGAAALLNMGTNFLCGKISFISNSVTVVLQLALAIDYAIILCHRYRAEHVTKAPREACIEALSKAIPEISSSSLTTIAGLVALAFMHFLIGRDMAVVLVKAIMLSLLSVFTLMPGLLILFSNLIDKTVHKDLVPKITAIGKFDVKTYKIVPFIFFAVIAFGRYFSNKCPYRYSYTDLTTVKQSESQIAYQKIKKTYGTENMVAIIVPAGNYTSEGEILKELDKCPEVSSSKGLSNVEAMDDYVLTSELTPRQFSEMVDMDYEVVCLLYTAYANENSQYGRLLNGVGSYKVPLYDMFMFVKDRMEDGNIDLGNDTQKTLDDLFDRLEKAQLQLQSADYSRMVVYLTVPEESPETARFLTKMHEIVGKYYTDNFYIVGNSTSAVDLGSSFAEDNLIISVLSALFVIIILLFTFQSAGLPVLLIIVIQGSIWINFSFPYLANTPLYFLGYLIVNSIQMGANIDYAIVVSSHYTELKQTLDKKDAMIETLNVSFPTIFTSGTILAVAGVLISVLTTNPVIAAIGTCLGRGTIISIVLVLGVLPQILLLGDSIIERTSFEMKGLSKLNRRQTKGTVYIQGRVRGYVNGVIDADVNGVLTGQLNALMSTTGEEKPELLGDGAEKPDEKPADETKNENNNSAKGEDKKDEEN